MDPMGIDGYTIKKVCPYFKQTKGLGSHRCKQAPFPEPMFSSSRWAPKQRGEAGIGSFPSACAERHPAMEDIWDIL